jgi:hypothetical protein
MEVYKQTLIAISTNHSEIIVLYEASPEYAWLRKVIDKIQTSCGMVVIESPPLSMKIMLLVLLRCKYDI